MVESPSLVDVLIQCAAFGVLGALLALLARRQPVQDGSSRVPDPRAGAVGALAAVGAGWILVMALLIGLRGDAPPMGFSDDGSGPMAGPGDVVGQMLVALVAAGPVFIVMRLRKEPLASAGASANALGHSLAVSVPLLAALAVWFLVTQWGEGIDLFQVRSAWALLQFLIVGLAEEFVYRGYLQTRLIGWLGLYRGWILASVLMAMAHVGHRVVTLGMTGTQALLSSASLVPVSLFLGFVMVRTRSIVAPGLLHAAINWVDLL